MQRTEPLEALKKTGVRLTPQRVMILQAIVQGDGHMTAEEIQGRVREVYPYIDLATVYRTLQLFKRLRMVTEIDLGAGASQYELAGSGRLPLVLDDALVNLLVDVATLRRRRFRLGFPMLASAV